MLNGTIGSSRSTGRSEGAKRTLPKHPIRWWPPPAQATRSQSLFEVVHKSPYSDARLYIVGDGPLREIQSRRGVGQCARHHVRWLDHRSLSLHAGRRHLRFAVARRSGPLSSCRKRARPAALSSVRLSMEIPQLLEHGKAGLLVLHRVIRPPLPTCFDICWKLPVACPNGARKASSRIEASAIERVAKGNTWGL